MKRSNSHPFTKRQQRAVLGGLFFLGLLVLHNNVVSLQLASLRAAQRYEQATSKRIKKENAIANELKAKRVELRKLLEAHASRGRVLFKDNEAQEFVRALEATCSEAGCEAISIDYNVPLRSGAITTPDSALVIVGRTVGLEVAGGYGDIVNLIEALQCQRQKVWLDRLQLSTNRSESGLIGCHIMLTIYTSQEKESRGDEQASQKKHD